MTFLEPQSTYYKYTITNIEDKYDNYCHLYTSSQTEFLHELSYRIVKKYIKNNPSYNITDTIDEDYVIIADYNDTTKKFYALPKSKQLPQNTDYDYIIICNFDKDEKIVDITRGKICTIFNSDYEDMDLLDFELKK